MLSRHLCEMRCALRVRRCSSPIRNPPFDCQPQCIVYDKRNQNACKERIFAMRLIQSPSNPGIRRVREILKGKDENLFVIEGKKLFDEAIRSGVLIEEVFATDEISKMHKNLLTKLEQQNVPIRLISARVARLISDVHTPPGLSGIARRPQSPDRYFTGAGLFLISLRDPGNFGAILRSAEGAGCEIVYHSSDCADPFQPKVVRASMGSIFRIPVAEVKDPKSFLKEQQARNVAVCGLVARGGVPLREWKPAMPVLLCVGSESHGLPQDLPLMEKISIPMKGPIESLNAAVAASLCLYWISLRGVDVPHRNRRKPE